jgi:hypothetical protein
MACEVEVDVVAVEEGGRGVLVIQALRVNGVEAPMLRGARVSVSGRARSSPAEVTFSLVPTSLVLRTVEPLLDDYPDAVP